MGLHVLFNFNLYFHSYFFLSVVSSKENTERTSMPKWNKCLQQKEKLINGYTTMMPTCKQVHANVAMLTDIPHNCATF